MLSALWIGLCASASAQQQDGLNWNQDQDEPIAVIAHPDVPVEYLEFVDLRSILLGNQRFWPGGERIHLVIDGRTDSPARAFWIEEITAMSEVQFTQYWIGMVFKGRANTAPHSVPESRTAVALVSSLPGALSVIESELATSQVKLIRMGSESDSAL